VANVNYEADPQAENVGKMCSRFQWQKEIQITPKKKLWNSYMLWSVVVTNILNTYSSVKGLLFMLNGSFVDNLYISLVYMRSKIKDIYKRHFNTQVMV